MESQQVYATRTTNYGGSYHCTTTTTVCLETRSTTSSRRSGGRRRSKTANEDTASSCRRSGSDKSSRRRRQSTSNAESNPYWASVQLFCPNAVLFEEVESSVSWEPTQWSSSALKSSCSGSPKCRPSLTGKEKCRPTSLFGAARGSGRPYAKFAKQPQPPPGPLTFTAEIPCAPKKKKVNKKLLKKRRARGLPDEDDVPSDLPMTNVPRSSGYRPCRSTLPVQPATPPSSSSKGFRPLPSPGLLPPMEMLPLTDCVNEDELCKWLRDIS